MPTPHIEAKEGDFAKTVIAAGDPLRAKFIAEKYLEDAKLVNSVRNMLMYTGTYKGRKISVISHGMGMPSAGIYFYELFKFYGVDRIIRIGTCGTSNPDIKLLDIILAESSYTESNYAFMFNKEHINLEKPSIIINDKLKSTAKEKNIKLLEGDVMTCDVFDPYVDWRAINSRIPNDLDVVATEMESFALFHIAKVLHKEAACLLTVVDSKCTKALISSEDREKSLTNMIEVALDTIY